MRTEPLMITPDPTAPNVITAPQVEIDQFLDAIGTGNAIDPVEGVSETFLASVSEILRNAAGSLAVTLSEPQGYSTHEFTLARAGVLRRSRGVTQTEDLAVHPTSTLPGLLLRLTSIAPVEPLPAESSLPISVQDVAGIFDSAEDTRAARWSAVIDAAGSLPPAHREDFEQAPPRAARLVRRRPEGERSAVVLLVRGRYLVAADDATELHGTSPTGAARALMTAMLKR